MNHFANMTVIDMLCCMRPSALVGMIATLNGGSFEERQVCCLAIDALIANCGSEDAAKLLIEAGITK